MSLTDSITKAAADSLMSMAGVGGGLLGNAERFFFSCQAFPGRFRVLEINGEEGVSRPYEYDLTLAVGRLEAQPELSMLVNEPALMKLHADYAGALDAPRLTHGIIWQMSRLREDDYFIYYRVRFVPSLMRLTQSSDCKIFQLKTIPDIITEVLSSNGYAGDDYRFILQENHPEREYVVQYRESHFDFIQRLLAEEGMYYFFTHEAARHMMVITDTPTVDQPINGNPLLTYHAPGGGVADFEHVHKFSMTERVRTGSYTHTDYDFSRPALQLETAHAAERFGELARFDYPGRYYRPDPGGDIARFRLEQHQVDQLEGTGASDVPRLQTGMQFVLAGHDNAQFNDKYFITSVRHHARQPQVLEQLGGSEPTIYSNSFTCIPTNVPYRTWVPDKPVVEGPQTAIVVGPPGEEIYVDEHGRVKVQFHWDRYGENNEFSSCWIRVSQMWAGAAYGGMIIPRIGHEVIVDFLEGDPDRPIITGRVYHGTNVPPYPLPENKTVSTWKSDTHKGSGSNEIRFEDEADKEEIYIHAQKDTTIVTENDKNQSTGHDETLYVGNNRSKRIEVDQEESVGQNNTITIGKDQTEYVGEDYTGTIGRHYSLDVGQTAKVTVVDKSDNKIGSTLLVDAGSDITAVSATKITLLTGASSIVMDAAGNIVIKGVNVTLEGAASVVEKGATVCSN